MLTDHFLSAAKERLPTYSDIFISSVLYFPRNSKKKKKKGGGGGGGGA